MTQAPLERFGVLPPELTIDDLTFADLMAVAREDLPASSGGAWTLHGAVDPGITLLELLAWRFEQRLFAAEQVTEPLVRAGLRLLGLGAPAAARPAATVLTVRGGGPARTIPAGAVFDLRDDLADRRFATDSELDVLPVHTVAVAGSPHGPGDHLDLTLDRDGPIVTDATLSLLLLVRSRGGVAPAWEPGAGVPPPADLTWSALGPDGREEHLVVADGTDGLRRSGLVRVPWPEAWNRVGGRGCRLRATATAGFWTEPVAVIGAFPNAVVARHLVPAEADVSDQLPALLVLPNQRLRLGPAGPVVDSPGSATLLLDEIDGATHEWQSVPDWVAIGPGERVFVVDRARGELVFGDGRSGRVPRPEPGGRALARYAVGAGTLGNLGSGSSWAQAGGSEVAVNPVPARGGAEPETVAEAQQRAADALAQVDRTVTRDDVETLALATPGVDVARALAAPGHSPGFPCVAVPGALTVVVVPGADRDGARDAWTRAPQPDPGVLAAVRLRLGQARLLGQEIFVIPPRYHAVRVWVTVTRTASAPTTAERVTDAIVRHLDPLVGGSGRDGWPFGTAVRPSDLLGVADRAVGDEATVTSLSVSLDSGPPADCGELAVGPRDLVWVEDVRVTTAAGVPAGGGLL